MITPTQTLLRILLLTSLSCATLLPSCSDVTFTISATAQNPLYASHPDPNNETDIINFVHGVFTGSITQANGTETVSGTYHINAIYCRPPSVYNLVHNDDVLEILVHGITYNKTYWSGLGFGDYYNWHRFANWRGYHTLAIDRLGHGTNPEKPDPFHEVEGAMQVEIMHQLIGLLKGDAGSPVGRRFEKIAYVGHSYGSFLGGAHARIYPSDIDALVLTGFSTSLAFSTVADLSLASAATLFPQRYAGTPLGYVVTAGASQRSAAFFAGGYDAGITPVDYASEDTVTTGEVAGLGFIIQPAPQYTNPVMVVAGVQDAIFCTPPVKTCEGVLNATGLFYPNSKRYEYAAIPNTGHDLTLHYSAPDTAARVHHFLDKTFEPWAL